MSKWLCIGKKKQEVIDYWDCSHFSLIDLPKEVWDTRATVRFLDLSSNAIKDIPKTLFQMHRLEDLNLSENEVLFLPPSISNLEFLTTLNLSKNSVSSIPDSIKNCHSLLTLDLSCNPLGELCDGLTELRQLRKLLLNDIQMEDLPANIGKLEKLEVLEARENMLQSLPASISHLSLLERLDIGTNEFVTLPHSIGSLESLSELWLDMNTINELPEEIGHLYNLRFLELSENHLLMLPESIGGWSNLTHLYLGENLLSLIPAAIGELRKLTILKLENNRLGGLPDTLDGLTLVNELSFAHNHIMELPPSIGGMTSLANLNLDNNLLSELPKEIGLCSSLSILSIRNNQLVKIPSEVSSLSQLSILVLTGNQLHSLPYALTQLTNITAIWIAENQSRPILDLQLSKNERGEKCLTCFLFPQQGAEPPYNEDASVLNSVIDDDRHSFERRTSQVNFDPKIQDKRSKINRDLTPFPKELHSKAMQWRATRDIVAGGGKPGEEGVALRQHPTKQLQNRTSLLTALANPLDEDNLLPKVEVGPRTGGRRGRHSSSRETTPHPHTIPEGEELQSPTRTTHNHSHRQTNRIVSPVSKTSQTSDSISPLPPPMLYSPEGSVAQSVQSGPYLDPPKEFASGPSPRGGTENGNASFGTGGISMEPAHVVINSNGNNNNNNNNNIDVYNVTYGKPQTAPSHMGSLSHSHNPEHLQSSMESGFIADNEQESSQPWYASPNGSPKNPRTEAQVKAGHVDTGYAKLSPANAISNSFGQKPSPRHPGAVSSQYDHLLRREDVKDKHGGTVGTLDPKFVLVHESFSPRGVVGGGAAYNHTVHNHQRYPPSSRGIEGSRSFDTAEVLSARANSGGGESAIISNYGRILTPPPGSSSSSSNSQVPSSVHAHSRSATPDYCDQMLRPSPLGEEQQTRHHLDHSHRSETRSQPTNQIEESGWKSTGMGKPVTGIHTGSHSKPEDTSYPSHALSLTSPPYLSSPQSRPHRHTSYGHNHVTDSSSTRYAPLQQHHGDKKRSTHFLSNDSIFQTSYPISHTGHKGHRPQGVSQVMTEQSSHDHQRQLSLDDNHTYSNLENGNVVNSSEGSQSSGRGLPTTTPISIKGQQQQHWSCGHDSGFESIKREGHSPSISRALQGNLIRLVLTKNPTLGLGITGGLDGENSIKPGDKGFHIYKVIEGLPAHKSGKINIGDKLLEVNGVDVSHLTNHELLALLTGTEKRVSLVLHREVSITLL